MKIRTLAVIPAAMLAVAVMPTVAHAHPVGEPGTPTCFGERMSHAASDHKLQLKDRIAGLQDLVDSGFGPALALFGPTVEPSEAQDFVRVNCSDNPYVPS